MALNAIHKGKAGEVQFCKWLFDNLGIEVERNYNQAKGGADVIVSDFIFEVKRRENLDLDTWWHQVCIAKKHHKDKDLIPIVCFRQNRQKWQFLMPANLITGIDKGYVQCQERVFLEYAKSIVNRETEVEKVLCHSCNSVWGFPNFEGEIFYCGGSPRCCP